MPAGDSPDVLVARFLRANNYHETFQAFIRETNLTADSITNHPTDLTIEQILEEKKLYDLAVRFEKINVDAKDVDFVVPYPTIPTTLTTLSTSFNILSVSLTSLILPIEDSTTQPLSQQVIISTSSDKSLRIYSAKPPYTLLTTLSNLHAGPILCVAVVSQKWLVTASMVGAITISDLKGNIVDKWTGHTKYIVNIAVSEPIELQTGEDGEEEIRYLAAASYDKYLSVHKLHLPKAINSTSETDTPSPRLEFLQTIKFDQTVEDVIFTKDYRADNPTQEPSSTPLLITTVRDSPYLHVWSTPSNNSSTTSSSSTTPSAQFTFTSKNPLNATSTSWLTYTPTSLTPHPHHPHLLAMITSSIPSPKVIIYNLSTYTVDKEFTVPVELSAYSTGIVAWRGDTSASGLWINGDDGVIKGVEIKSGKVKAELKGHNGRKVRCLAAAAVSEEDEEEELMISGGFDGGLNVWRIGDDASV
ncbi:hypothetical protein TWF569_001588 [Orbilia oligospora]|uniref:Uncharacterized protein n=1 Tax=Orbilia oligospora TaxID=2813651 RepID=A0A7C8J145_ORBOL|nr:hypothetical protein TWF102_010643 [Orbilia oligospora]KAF3100506.1 hypothetical protein TWF103_008228 [Orbilia oligospora]KAF3110950.1 hypothetical protein TWF706_000409 [Orbilia oligospora]KAF3123963.1 hypothetical protein TWF569_001588 [Orbilia oligospora]KAF3139082.1 hypothetical protein TWF594_006833 [Orbilia oligospora]